MGVGVADRGMDPCYGSVQGLGFYGSAGVLIIALCIIAGV